MFVLVLELDAVDVEPVPPVAEPALLDGETILLLLLLMPAAAGM